MLAIIYWYKVNNTMNLFKQPKGAPQLKLTNLKSYKLLEFYLPA